MPTRTGRPVPTAAAVVMGMAVGVATGVAMSVVLGAGASDAIAGPGDGAHARRGRGVPLADTSRGGRPHARAKSATFEFDPTAEEWTWEDLGGEGPFGGPPGLPPLSLPATGGARAIPLMFEPTGVRIEAPAGSVVTFQMRRMGGPFAELLGVEDAVGRLFLPRPTLRTAGRVEFEAVPVHGDGGLTIWLAPWVEPVFQVTLAAVVQEAQGDLPVGPLAWAPGRVVGTFDSGYGTATDVADDVGADLIEDLGGCFVLGTPEERFGQEWYDAGAFGSAWNGGFGGVDFDVDAVAEPPEGSQANAIFVGSTFGRLYLTQAALRAIQVPVGPRALDGQGSVIAVIDSGVDASHPRLAGRVLPGLDLVDGDADASEERQGFDGDGDGDVDESFGHGTMVASIALAVAPKSVILPIRVLDPDGRATASRVAAAVQHAVMRGAHVINLSLGSRTRSRVLEDAVRAALDAGVVVVAASGNDGDPFAVDFPGSLDGVISVGALNVRQRKPSWANGAKTATIYAPAANIVGCYPEGLYGMAKGTSFAAPLVAGAAALHVAPGRDVSRDGLSVAAQLTLDPTKPSWRLDLRRLFADAATVHPAPVLKGSGGRR